MNEMELLNDILMDMATVINDKDLSILHDVIIKNMNNYRIVKKAECKYGLVTTEELNNNLLKEYVAKKYLTGISKNSLRQYVRETDKFLKTINKKATEITSDDIQKYLFLYKVKYNVSNTTSRNMFVYINNFFLFLTNADYITKNPFDKIDKIKRDTLPEPALTKQEEEKLYVNCNSIRDRALLEFLFSTGCRVSEVSNCKISDVNTIDKTVTVVGKGNKRRTVFISDKALYHLQRYLMSRNDNIDALFISNRNQPLSVDGIELALDRLASKSNVHPHRIRATFCTRLIDKGMDIHKVQKLMGHSQVDTTMGYYRGNDNIGYDYNKLINN
jgi:site-specific recombinase XerD